MMNDESQNEVLARWSVKGVVDRDVPIDNDVLWEADPEVLSILASSADAEAARHGLWDLMRDRKAIFHERECQTEALERANAINCIRVIRNFLSPRNERLSGISVISHLHELANTDRKGHPGFLFDIANLLRGTMGRSGISGNQPSDVTYPEGGEGAILRSEHLDAMAASVERWVRRYATGLDPKVIGMRRENKSRIMDYFNASDDDWNDYSWQMRHVLMSADVIGDLIDLTADEAEAIRLCTSNHVPFGVTPYYLSLMDRNPGRTNDHAVRAQVLPPLSYVRAIVSSRKGSSASLDFMMEGQTSPVDLVTRRYPMIAIFKPYNTCAQICVYCQRNWEIDGVLSPDAMASQERIDAAMDWFRDHPMVSEVLVTGGDPAVMSNGMLRNILGRLAEMDHIRAIRMGTRVPVVMPMRIDRGFLDLISKLHDPPKRTFTLVTHFEHVYEVTPEAAACVASLRHLGISVYNQQVFTLENCRRFETVALRLALKSIGIDPYYTFNAKGKEETSDYRVPISRLLQERKEEARLIPGSARTDEPVFNIPALGKNHLRAWQHHDLISLTPNGERVYEFHPWEKNISPASTYIHRDVPIYDFLMKMAERGENVGEYDSIWYYL